MTQPHAKRRGSVPRPSEKHLAMVARLAKRAEIAAKAPDDAKKALILTQEAERVAKKAILPVGHQQDPASPVVRLVRLAKAWHGLSERASSAMTLTDLSVHTREVLDAALLELKPQPRKDIDA